jgi:hypothetical protein
MQWTKVLCALAVGVVVGVGCGIEEPTASDELIEITTLTGEKQLIPKSRICWETATTVPEGFVAVPRPELNRVDFVAADAEDKDVSAYFYGGVTCTCTSGSGCNPSYAGGQYFCAMTSGCNQCTRS